MSSTGEIHKLDAAKSQLDQAIKLWFSEGDAISIYTLAAAAHQIIHDVLNKKGKELAFNNQAIPKPVRRAAIKTLTDPANFFKHADRDPDRTLKFSPKNTELLILFSVAGLTFLGEEQTDLHRVYLNWLTFNRPDVITIGSHSEFRESLPINQLNDIRRMSKQEFFDAFISIYRE